MVALPHCLEASVRILYLSRPSVLLQAVCLQRAIIAPWPSCPRALVCAFRHPPFRLHIVLEDEGADIIPTTTGDVCCSICLTDASTPPHPLATAARLPLDDFAIPIWACDGRLPTSHVSTAVPSVARPLVSPPRLASGPIDGSGGGTAPIGTEGIRPGLTALSPRLCRTRNHWEKRSRRGKKKEGYTGGRVWEDETGSRSRRSVGGGSCW